MNRFILVGLDNGFLDPLALAQLGGYRRTSQLQGKLHPEILTLLPREFRIVLAGAGRCCEDSDKARAHGALRQRVLHFVAERRCDRVGFQQQPLPRGCLAHFQILRMWGSIGNTGKRMHHTKKTFPGRSYGNLILSPSFLSQYVPIPINDQSSNAFQRPILLS